MTIAPFFRSMALVSPAYFKSTTICHILQAVLKYYKIFTICFFNLIKSLIQKYYDCGTGQRKCEALFPFKKQVRQLHL